MEPKYEFWVGIGLGDDCSLGKIKARIQASVERYEKEGFEWVMSKPESVRWSDYRRMFGFQRGLFWYGVTLFFARRE